MEVARNRWEPVVLQGRDFFGRQRAERLHSASINMSPSKFLWIYVVFLVVGGLIGYLKAGSTVSLYMSLAFAVALSFCAAGIVFQHYVADILLLALLIVFAMRLAKTAK